MDRITIAILAAIFGGAAVVALLKWPTIKREIDVSKIPKDFAKVKGPRFRARFDLPPRRPEVIDVLTFRDVVGYFTDKRPGDPRIRAGALLSSHHPKGRLIFQVFLDDDDKVCSDPSGTPYGRRLVARRLDDELAARFGASELLIFR